MSPRQWGRIDFLLNDAGASNAKGILEIKEEEFDRTIAVNLKSCFNYIHATAPIMLKQERGRADRQHVVAERALGRGDQRRQQAFVRRRQGGHPGPHPVAGQGTRTQDHDQCDLPGRDETDLGNSLTRSRGEEMKKGIVLDRLGKPADVAQLVAFLATSEPCFITGQHFVIDGFQWSC